MAVTDAIIGYGAIYRVEDAAGSGVYVPLAGITKLQKPNPQRGEADATHMQSPNSAEEQIATLINYGESTYDLTWTPNNVTDTFIEAWAASGETRSAQLVYPNGVIDTVPQFVKGWSGEIPVKDVMTGQLTVKNAGAKVRT